MKALRGSSVDVDHLEQTMRDQGARLTFGRRRIVHEIAGMTGHISAGDIVRRLEGGERDVDVSTVYRTIERLCELGLLHRTHVNHGVTWYHHADVPPHHHLICRECGSDEELRLEELQLLAEILRRRHGFIVDLSRIGLTGVCRNCTNPSP